MDNLIDPDTGNRVDMREFRTIANARRMARLANGGRLYGKWERGLWSGGRL